MNPTKPQPAKMITVKSLGPVMSSSMKHKTPVGRGGGVVSVSQTSASAPKPLASGGSAPFTSASQAAASSAGTSAASGAATISDGYSSEPIGFSLDQSSQTTLATSQESGGGTLTDLPKEPSTVLWWLGLLATGVLAVTGATLIYKGAQR